VYSLHGKDRWPNGAKPSFFPDTVLDGQQIPTVSISIPARKIKWIFLKDEQDRVFYFYECKEE
jgi:hypothetical protein